MRSQLKKALAMTTTTYPVHVDAELDPGLSRWLWLVKWALAIPHYVLLSFLWLAFVVLSVVAFFAILFTGKYPRSIFEFNVGVLRWTWRVAYYAYGALGTDRYPPFTLHEVADYPAHLEVDYPAHLSRGLVLVKWWLLAIPHYIVVGLLLGGGGYVVRQGVDHPADGGAGLIGLLVLVAGVVLLFTGRYPQPFFDLILGLNRWVLRVAGYAGLMTDQYPPFALDQGGHEGGSGRGPAVVIDPPASPPSTPSSQATPTAAAPTVPPASPSSGWTSGRVVSVTVGAVLAVVALLTGIAGIGLGAADRNARNDDGFMMTHAQPLTTSTYAIASSTLQIHMHASSGNMPKAMLGDATLTAAARNGKELFLGIGPSSQVRAYLAGVDHATLVDLTNGDPVLRTTDGPTPASMPERMSFWIAQTAGSDHQQLTWPVGNGDWTAVLMNRDASPGVAVTAAAGAEVPAMPWLVGGLLCFAGVALATSTIFVWVPTRAVRRGGARTR
jgi:hypothetical protein